MKDSLVMAVEVLLFLVSAGSVLSVPTSVCAHCVTMATNTLLDISSLVPLLQHAESMSVHS